MTEAIQLTITSDGTPNNTVIADQHGRRIDNVVALRWEMKDPKNLATCTLVLDTIFFKFDVKARDGTVFLRPYPWWQRMLARWKQRRVSREWQRKNMKRAHG